MTPRSCCRWVRRRALLLPIFLAVHAVVLAWTPLPHEAYRDGPVPFALHLSDHAPAFPIDWHLAANEAAEIWNARLQRVQLVPNLSQEAAWFYNGKNELFFGEEVLGQQWGKGVLAITAITTRSGVPIESDIVVNPNVSWARYDGPLRSGTIDIRRVLLHEFGHMLGLGHPDEAGQQIPALMNSTVGDAQTLTDDDVTGARALYDHETFTAPVIISPPSASDPAPVAGSWTRLRTTAGGRGPIVYQWYRNNQPVVGANSPQLTLDPVTTGDSGTYTLVVSNPHASTTSASLYLAVQPVAAPTVVAAVDQMVQAEAGTDAWLRPLGLIAPGPLLQCEWRRNGVAVAHTSQPELQLRDVQLGDSGAYTVTVTNAGGTVTSAGIQLNVNPGRPPQLLTELPTQLYRASASMSLHVEASGTEPLAYQWRHDGVLLPESTATLDLPSFRLRAGIYTLTVSNRFGAVTSRPIHVRSSEERPGKPQIRTHPASRTEFAGVDLRLQVEVENAHKIEWFKDGQPLPDPGDNRLLQSAYVIRALGPQDAGSYSVRVTNTSGSVMSRPARVEVLPARSLIITRQPSPHTIAVGGTVNLRVEVHRAAAVPDDNAVPPTYQWYRDGVPLPPGGPSLFFSDAKVADSGRYSVRVTGNAAEFVESEVIEVRVTEGVAPFIMVHPPNFLVDLGNSEHVRLFKVSLMVLSRGASANVPSELRLIEASGPPADDIVPGTYVVEASSGGRTERSRPFTVGFLPAIAPVLSWHPASRQIVPGEQFSIGIGAAANAPLTYQWFKDGAPLPGAVTGSLTFLPYTAADAGRYEVRVSSPAGSVLSDSAHLETIAAPGPLFLLHPVSSKIVEGGQTVLSVRAAGEGVTYQWLKDGVPVPGAIGAELRLNVTSESEGRYEAVASAGIGSSRSEVATLTMLRRNVGPEILFHPTDQAAWLGGDAVFYVGAVGDPLPDRYQWQRDGVDLPGENSARLRLTQLRGADAGRYTVVVRNPHGTRISEAATLRIESRGRLSNLSTRARVGRGENVLIAGFVISGDAPRSLLIRAVGGRLEDFGVTGFLYDPELTVFDATSNIVARNNDWGEGENDSAEARAKRRRLAEAARDAGAFSFNERSMDSALIAELAPGSYTARVSGLGKTSGVALVEVYELGPPAGNRLINLSCRSHVGVGANIVIPGIVITGEAPRRLLIRGIGPGLGRFGVDGALAAAQVAVFRGQEQIASNRIWHEQGSANAIEQAAQRVGAFPLMRDQSDASLLLELAPGNYTVHLSGVDGATGVALMEVYEISDLP